MGYEIVHLDELRYQERPYRDQDPPRLASSLTDALGLSSSRASVWRYPPGAHGRRHRELVQEEVFVVIGGSITMLLGDPPRHADLRPGSIVRVEPGTALQIRNESEGEATLLIWGAPPQSGAAEMLEDLDH